ncbi:MAG TPA: SusC/RagA family TonB-linked outer membrane protein, partial [Sphingobacteriaceae bacterium]
IGPIYPVRAYDAAGQPIMNPITGEQWYDYGMHPGAVNRPQGASAGRHVIYESMLNDNLAKRNNLGARTYVDVKFLKDFTFTPSFSVDIRNNNSTEYRNPLIGDGATLSGYAWNSNSNTRSYTFNQILKYNKSFGSHTITALAGHENYDYNYRVASASKTGQILQGNTQFENFVTPYSASGYQDRETLESYFSRVNYDFNEKYFLEASIRRDGSSRFHEDSRWGTFYSAGASWSISKEPFMSKYTWIDDLRLKASYGQVGVNALSTLYAYQAFYELGWNNGTEPGMLLSTAATPDLQWEKQNTFNTGISFSLFKNRLFGDLEYFKKGSDRLIFGVPQPLSSPVTSILKNIGSMYNSGVELTLGGDVIRAKDFNWGITTNWSVLKNEITKMPAETPAITSGTKRREVGKDYYAYYLRQFRGVDPSDGSSLYVPADGTAAANIRTVNGVDYVTNQTYAKFDYTGSSIPDLAGSVNNIFRFKDISLSFLVNYQIGGEFYDSEYAGLMSPRYGSSLHKDVLNAWTTPGQVTDIPRIDIGSSTNLNAASTRWLKDASYVAFRNVNLSYALPASVLNRIKVQNARVFVTGENLGLISARKGMNPTESFDGTNGAVYLPSRTLSFGVNFTL